MDISSLFLFVSDMPADSRVIMDCYHEPILVFVSYGLASVSAGVALIVAERIIGIESWAARCRWAALGGLSMGVGIWAMHFTAMEAFRTPVIIEYDIWITFISMLVAIIFCALALVLYSSNHSLLYTFLSSLLIGTGIVFMHYLGMGALVMPATLYYSPLFFTFSIFIAVAAPFVALMTSKLFIDGLMPYPKVMRVICSAAMGIAITGMHFTSMVGTTLVVNEDANISSGVTIARSPELSLVIMAIALITMALCIYISNAKRPAIRQATVEQPINTIN